MNIVKYAKASKTAFKNYISNEENLNNSDCKTMYEYIMHIESLDSKQNEELSNFIENYAFDTIHLGSIYTNEQDNHSLKSQLERMIPLAVSNTDARVYQANGNFSQFYQNKKEIKVKRKMRFKK